MTSCILEKVKTCVFDSFEFTCGEIKTKEYMSVDIDLLYILYPNEHEFVRSVKKYVKEFVVEYYLKSTFSRIDDVINDVNLKKLERLASD